MRTLLVAVLVAVLAGCARSRPPPAATFGSVEGAVAAVGDVRIPASLVADVARVHGTSPRPALDALVEDALAAEGARSRGIDRETSWPVTVALAQTIPERFAADAAQAGPPTDDELAMITVIHAVVRPTRLVSEAREVAIAQAIATSVASARTPEEFQAKAEAVPAGPLVRVLVERLAAFDASGHMTDGLPLDPTFVAAAFTLHTAGDTTDVVYTPFGWHVIRLISRVPPAASEIADKRSSLADAVVLLRARSRLDALLRARRRRTLVEVSGAADELMAAVPLR